MHRTRVAICSSLALAGALIVATPTTASAANGCQDISMGAGVYNSTTFEYANNWSISPVATYENYTWYLKRTDDSIVDSYGPMSGGMDRIYTPAHNNYRIQIHNLGTSAHTYEVCYWDE